MTRDLRDFLRQFQRPSRPSGDFPEGIEAVVWNDLPEKRLGVHDGFHRFFGEGAHAALSVPWPVSVQAEALDDPEQDLPMSDADILTLARRRAAHLEATYGGRFDFYVGVEAGMMTATSQPLPGDHGAPVRHFVHCWAVVRGLGEEAWGSSGAVQLPHRLIEGLDDAEAPLAIPGRRRGGGMVSSLTGGLETRRSAAAQATFHALASLMYGPLQNPSRPR